MAQLAATMANVAYGVGVRAYMRFLIVVGGVMGEDADAHFARMRKRTKDPGR
jgi:hypothetical protein